MVCKAIISQDSIPDILSMTADAYKNLEAADSALVYYDHVLRMKPYHVKTLSKKADILLSAKQYMPVIDMSREYLKNDPENMTMLPIYGLALHLQGSYTLSIEQFEHLLELGDESYAAHYYLGLNHYMMDNWPRAIPEFEKAYQSTEQAIKEMGLAEVDAFVEEFIPAFHLSLDEQNSSQ